MSDDALRWAVSLIEEAIAKGSYGQVTVVLEAGKVVRAKVEVQQRPPDFQELTRPRAVPGGKV